MIFIGGKRKQEEGKTTTNFRLTILILKRDTQLPELKLLSPSKVYTPNYSVCLFSPVENLSVRQSDIYQCFRSEGKHRTSVEKYPSLMD